MSDPGTGTDVPQGFPNIAQPFVNSAGLINQVWRQFLRALWARTGSATGGLVIQPGTIQDFGGATMPAGFLLCDGTAYSRLDYPNLFNAIGTIWGPGDGSSTFNVPDLIGRTTIGAIPADVGGIGGANSVTLSVGNLPSHNHGVTDPGHSHGVTDPHHTHTITDPGHIHTAAAAASNGTAGAAPGAVAGNTGSATTGITINSAATGVTINSATTGITTNDTGAGDPVSIRSPYAQVLKMIKI